MGTSASGSGPGSATPLVPTWLSGDEDSGNGDSGTPEGGQPDAEGNPEGSVGEPVAPASLPAPPIPAPPTPQRFRGSRSSLSRFAGSGGSEGRALRRGISSYVRTGTGGSRRAAQRMGSSRTTGARLASFLVDSQRHGATEALRRISLAHLADRPIHEVLSGVADVVCPDGGTIDEGIARRAFMETVADVAILELGPLESVSDTEMETIFESFTANAILGRILNDVGTKAIVLPASVDAAVRVERQIRDYIKGAVHDSISRCGGLAGITQVQVNDFVRRVYETAFEILGGRS